jgi:hypothetical protein
MTISIKLTNLNGSLIPNKSFAPVRSGAQRIKLTGSNGSFLSYPTDIPTIATAAINDLSLYPNTATVLAYDATTYANAVAYTNISTNNVLNTVANNYTNNASLRLKSLNDINEPPAVSNNSTLVYDTITNKYIVKQINLDGGNF